MKKRLLFVAALIFGVVLIYNYSTQESNTNKLRKQHAEFLKNHPFQKVVNLGKKDRKKNSLPPNAFFEQEYLNEISPITGKTYPENIFQTQENLRLKRTMAQRVPGDGNDNAWVERGPNNVGGRVRATMFDPNDTSNETVFAGGVTGGLWKNTNISDPNSVWTRVEIPDNLGISSITYDPNDSKTFYIGTGESYVGHTTGSATGDGVWKSVDGGTTWSRIFGGSTGPSYFQASSYLDVNSPSTIAGSYAMYPTTNFGTEISSIISGEIILVDDGTSSPTEGCNAPTNANELNGKIALIRRGNCNFTTKVKNAEDAGAIAVIMMNNTSGAPIPMGGSDATITISSVMISKENGDLLESALATESVNVSLNPSTGSFSAIVVPGAQHINDIKIRDNNGVSEIFVGVSDATYGSSNAATSVGGLSYGLYKSSDGGSNWTEISFPLTANENKHCPNDIEIGADGKVWVSTTTSRTFGDGGGVVFSSTDGVNFTQKYFVIGGARTQIATSSTDANKIYVLAEISTGVRMVKTSTGFLNQTTLDLPEDADTNIDASDFTRGQAFYDLMIDVDPNNDENLFVGGIDLFKSTNGGTSWDQISHWYGGFGYQEVHSDQHLGAFAHGNSSRMVFGNDGGIYFSDDAGVTISARNNGFNITQFYTIGVAPTTALSGDYFVAGAQDNGTQLFEEANAGVDGSTEPYGGDGAYSFFDQDGTDKYYIRNYVYNNSIDLFNYVTNASRSINSENPATGNGSFINEEELDSNLNILYSNYSAGSNYIIKRYKNLLSLRIDKANLTDALLNSSPRAFKVSPFTTTSTKLLVGTVLGDLLKVENADGEAPSWTEISGPSFVGSISDIEFGQTEDDIFVTIHNYNVVSIWYTNDGGQTWLNKEGDFPDIPVKAILQNPLNIDEVIIGTELGVWKTSNFYADSPNWKQSYNGMSNAKVLDLDLRDDNKVFAATHGRGVFSGDFTAEVASVDDVLADNKVFTVYPTVSKGDFTVFAKNTLGKSKMSIFNINGKEVYKSDLNFNTNEKQQVSVHLNAGVYIVNLIDENNRKSSNKIIIE